jgi:hypothetical protein
VIASGSVQHIAFTCSFATRRRLRFPSLLLAGLDFGSALQIDFGFASQIALFLIFERHELCSRIAVENYFFLSVSCVLVAAIGNTRTAFIAGPSAVAADLAGGARCAVALADRLALIVCVIFAHLRPVYYAAFSKYGLSRFFPDAPAILVWRAHTRQSFLNVAWAMQPPSHFDPFLCLQI